MVKPEEQDPAMNEAAQPENEQTPSQAESQPGPQAEVAEQEEAIGEDAHDAMAEEEANTEEEDFSQLGKHELKARLEALSEDDNPLRVNRKIQDIKDTFQVYVEREYQQQLQDFLAAGNDEMDFNPKADPEQDAFYQLYRAFKKRRDAQIEKLNQEREENLKAKRRILDQMKHLTEHLEEEPNSIQRFRQLQDEWRQIGQVPKQEVTNLREAYRFYVKRFYDSQSIYREFKELDRKKNKERKDQLTKQLEDLAQATDPRLISRETRRSEEEWHRVGPVPEAEQQAVEQRYQAAMKAAEQQREQLEAAIREQEEQNLAAKWHIVEQIRTFEQFESERPKDWVAKNDELSGLINEWKRIGYVPRHQKAALTQAFNEAVKAFNHRKNQFFKRKKKERAQNLQRKRAIVEEVQQLLEPGDFKAAKEQVFGLQREWKSLGRVPGKESDRLWERFRELCDQFFDNLGAHYQEREQQEVENLKEKEALCETIEQAAEAKPEDPEAQVREFQQQWEAIGYVPIKEKKRIQDRYHKGIQRLLNKAGTANTTHDSELQRLKLKVTEWKDKGNHEQLKTEQRKLNKRLKVLSEEISTLEENINLFGRTEGARQLAQQYQERLDNLRQEHEAVRQKIAVLNA